MIALLIIVGILALLVMGILLYHNQAYPEAVEIAGEMERVGKDYSFRGHSGVGFIIFSGAKTDEKAYAYIAKLLHEQGHTVVIPKQRFYLSLFGTKHGMEIMDSYPGIQKWILIGHSLGGMPVSRIAAAGPDGLAGLAFLATYASVDLSKLDIGAIRITADHDGIMNNDFMMRYDGNLPHNASNIMLQGANHQGFAAYHSTSGRDGEASLSWQEQNEQTVRLILDYFKGTVYERNDSAK
ncbi:MAG: alpha/beta hydrolase [Lachnospiraceae bacterium]|nr:alpha/beta hydrolase [Lachnospiraceae bacterium]